MTQYPKGSAGEAEQKSYRIFLVVAAAITVLLFLLQVTPMGGEYRQAVIETYKFLNVIGHILTLGSWGFLFYATKAGEEGSAGYVFGWLGALAAGFLICAAQGL